MSKSLSIPQIYKSSFLNSIQAMKDLYNHDTSFFKSSKSYFFCCPYCDHEWFGEVGKTTEVCQSCHESVETEEEIERIDPRVYADGNYDAHRHFAQKHYYDYNRQFRGLYPQDVARQLRGLYYQGMRIIRVDYNMSRMCYYLEMETPIQRVGDPGGIQVIALSRNMLEGAIRRGEIR